MRFTYLTFLLLFPLFLTAQTLVVDPPFPLADDNVTITYDVSQGNAALVGVGQIYAHTGVITSQSSSPTDWQHVIGNWGTADATVAMTNIGNNKHQISFNIRNFYGLPMAETLDKLAFVFRNVDGTVVGRDTDGGDIFYCAGTGIFEAAILVPQSTQVVILGETVQIEAAASESATLTLFDNGTQVAQTSGTLLSETITANSPGNHIVILEADNATQTVIMDTINYVVSEVTIQDPPPGREDGITYLSNTSVYLQLYAPGKNYVVVTGSFNNYQVTPDYFMNKSVDGSTYWIELTGLTAGDIYTFQYNVDGEITIADPYSDLILDPFNDQFIGAATYPDMPIYPSGQSGMVSVLQPGKTPYNWQNNNFAKPKKTDLVAYELLLRDFVANHDYKTLKDTLDYLENLGVNAIQLMPINEFEGNISWGYNPSFHMALDKYYGPANDFKALVDECHGRGIAVILDVVFNHAFSQSPLCQLYWDDVNFRPTAENPWLNVVAKHPFNVGYDFNHESPDFQRFMDKALAFWQDEYRVDGFRFDLSKGFTQNQTCDNNGENCNVGSWGNYDASRIALIKRMADELWTNDPESLLILEHFADNNEEIELSNYGLLLWGSANCNYNQASMAYGTGPCNWDFNGAVSYQTRGWNTPGLVGFMESHDEERLMFRNLQFGNSNGSYDIKDLETALARQELVSTFFYTVPGPKMLWQFGEVGYDYTIEYCQNGTTSPNCRLDPKPIRWDYFEEAARRKLYNVTAALTKLRVEEPAFETSNYDLDVGGAAKRIRLAHPDMNVVVLGNFDVVPQSVTPAFHNTGWWYEYFSGDSLNVTDVNASLPLLEGEYRIYMTKKVDFPSATEELSPELASFSIFPNPMDEQAVIAFDLKSTSAVTIELFDLTGRKAKQLTQQVYPAGKQFIELDGNKLSAGIYFVRLRTEGGFAVRKLVIQ